MAYDVLEPESKGYDVLEPEASDSPVEDFDREQKRAALQQEMEKVRKERKVGDFAQRAAEIAQAAIEPLTPSGMMNQPFRAVGMADPYQAGKPLVSIPKPTGTGVLSGIGQLAAQTVEGLTTPEMIVTGAAFPASPVARALVAGEMASTLPESISAGAEALRSPEATPAQKVVGAGTPLVTAAFVRGIAKTPEWLPDVSKPADQLIANAEAVLPAAAAEAKKGVTDASSITKATEVHGDVLPREEPAQVVPVEGSGSGIQPQTGGGIQEAQGPVGAATGQERVLLESAQVTPKTLALEAQREAGWNPKWPFVPADLGNASFREAIRNDPSLSASEKAKIFSAGEKLLGFKFTETEAKPSPVAQETSQRIQLEPAPNLSGGFWIIKDGEQIGSIQIHRDHGSGKLHVSNIGFLNKKFRGQGLGAQAVIEAAKVLQERIYSGFSQTTDARRMWDRIATGEEVGEYGKLFKYVDAPVSEAKPSLLAQEKAPQPAAPEAALGESSKGVVEPTSTAPPPAISEAKPASEIAQVSAKGVTLTPVEQSASLEAKAIQDWLDKYPAAKGEVPARKPYLPSRNEAFARLFNDNKVSSEDIGQQPSQLVPKSEDARHAIETGVKLGYRPEDISRYLIRNYVSKLSAETFRDLANAGKQESNPTTVEAWHQTTPESAAVIQKEGFKPGKGGFLGPAVYVATSPDIISTRLQGKPSERLKVSVTGNLLDISPTAPNTPLEILKRLLGDDEGSKFYSNNKIWVDNHPNWELLNNLAKEKGYVGYKQRDASGYDRIAVFDTTAIKQVDRPSIIGMGGATAGEKPVQAQIEQLTEAFKGVESAKAPLGERIKASFRIGENSASAKDALSKAVNGLKTAGDYLITKWRGVPDVDSFRRAEGELSGQLETRGWRVREWVKQARTAVPDRKVQAAIAKWVDAGGDRAALEQGLRETKPEYKQAYQDAINLKGDLLTAAENIRNYFDSRLQEAIDAGVVKQGVEDYIHRIYESRPDVAEKAIARLQSGLLKPNPGIIKKRVFDYDWEAEKLGYRPVQSFVERISAYEAALSKAIASREFIKKATTMKAADGRPVVDVKGVGVPIENEFIVLKRDGTRFVTSFSDKEAAREFAARNKGTVQELQTPERAGTLIKPQFNPSKANEPGTENYRGDYVNKEFPSLSKWKWVSTDAAGKPIIVQGDVAIHPDYASRITALLEPSRVRYGKYGSIARPVLKASSTIKQTMLSLSGFHNVQILVHGMEHKVMPWKLVQKIDFADPNVDALLKGGVTLGGDFYGGFTSEGLFGTALTHKIPLLGPLAESYQTWLFQSFIPRMKMTMALNALDRNRARFAGKMTDEQIAFKTAYEANSAFGELNYILLERSKTTQDLARLILLAPDFLEARGRFALEGLEKGGKSKVPGFGNEQRAALLLGAMTMYITARIANKILDDQYHFEPENMFSVVYKNHAYSLRTVQGDILHLIEHPLQFWMNRLNPGITRPLLQLATGRDYFGRKRTPLQTLWDTAVNMIPISLRHGRERKIWESISNSFGINARRYNATDDAFKLAQKWKEQNGIQDRGEFIYDSEKDPLRPLKIALSSDDDVAAAAELKKLFDSGVTHKKLNDYFNRYAQMPFTGSKANDRKWMATLKEDDRKTVLAAIEHKKAIRDLYRKAREIYDSRPEKPGEATK